MNLTKMCVKQSGSWDWCWSVEQALHALKVRGWWMGGLQDFSISRSPLGTNLSFELGWTLDWTGLDIGDLGSQGFGDRA